MKVLTSTIITGTAGGAAPQRRGIGRLPVLLRLEFALSLAAVARPVPKSRRNFERLSIDSFANRVEMGAAAASDIASALRERLSTQAGVRMIFAAAPCQADTLDRKSVVLGKSVSVRVDIGGERSNKTKKKRQ